MQLKQQTDYAIRILLFLSKNQRVVPTRELAAALAIPESLLPKIARHLRAKGWIYSETGLLGGYSLNRDPKTISLFDIIHLMENQTTINRCIDGVCTLGAQSTCTVHFIYDNYQRFMEWYFSSISIADLLTHENIATACDKITNEIKAYHQSREAMAL